MNKDELWIIVLALFIAFCCWIWGFSYSAQVHRDESVSAGHAEYYLDANHNKQWRWKEAK